MEIESCNQRVKTSRVVEAESEGRYLMSTAKKIVAKKTGVSQAIAASILRNFGGKEYYLTSKFYTCTNFFDTRAAIRAIELSRELGYWLQPGFIGAFIADGLQDDCEWEKFNKNRIERIAEFRTYIETGEYSYLVK